MSDSNSSLEFIYKKENKPYPCLNYSDNKDGTALLTNPTCKNRKVILDQSVVKYLKQIQDDLINYCFEYNTSKTIWFINPLPDKRDSSVQNLIGFVSGDMTDDGETIICTNAILNPVLIAPPTEP